VSRIDPHAQRSSVDTASAYFRAVLKLPERPEDMAGEDRVAGAIDTMTAQLVESGHPPSTARQIATDAAQRHVRREE
jgi:hypothetical protein